ncbi:hypothetical protein C8N47_106132 [Mangrovibacterium marinum]|uniref:Uncharacterized protein n=1 Tax=Mangrovibacterium marinum TaxID=1639118 RepID=A0A2T5C2W2_9BACT|nr:hypothetical protein C8N47_106132 [Mangrovibacterium marinum]
MDGIDQISRLFSSDSVRTTVTTYYYRFDSKFTRYLLRKTRRIGTIVASQNSLLTIILINLIPLAYLYGKSCGMGNTSLWHVFKSEFYIILPFTILSMSLRRINRFFLNILLYAAITFGVQLGIYIFKKFCISLLNSKSRNNVSSRT